METVKVIVKEEVEDNEGYSALVLPAIEAEEVEEEEEDDVSMDKTETGKEDTRVDNACQQTEGIQLYNEYEPGSSSAYYWSVDTEEDGERGSGSEEESMDDDYGIYATWMVKAERKKTKRRSDLCSVVSGMFTVSDVLANAMESSRVNASKTVTFALATGDVDTKKGDKDNDAGQSTTPALYSPSISKNAIILKKSSMSRLSILSMRGRTAGQVDSQMKTPSTPSGTGNERQLACPLCPLQFDHKSGLDEHVANYHEEEMNLINMCNAKKDGQTVASDGPDQNSAETTSQYPQTSTDDPVVEQKRKKLTGKKRKKLAVSSGKGSPAISHTRTDRVISPADVGQPIAELDRCRSCGRSGLLDLNQHVNKFHPDWLPCLFSLCTAWFNSWTARARHLINSHPPDAVRRLPKIALSVEEDLLQPDQPERISELDISPEPSQVHQDTSTTAESMELERMRRRRKDDEKTIVVNTRGSVCEKKTRKRRNSDEQDEEWKPWKQQKGKNHNKKSSKLIHSKSLNMDGHSDSGIGVYGEGGGEGQNVERSVSPEPVAVGLTCRICSVRMASGAGLASHMQKMHGNGYASRCPLCHVWYTGVQRLRRHIKKEHGLPADEVRT